MKSNLHIQLQLWDINRSFYEISFSSQSVAAAPAESYSGTLPTKCKANLSVKVLQNMSVSVSKVSV